MTIMNLFTILMELTINFSQSIRKLMSNPSPEIMGLVKIMNDDKMNIIIIIQAKLTAVCVLLKVYLKQMKKRQVQKVKIL